MATSRDATGRFSGFEISTASLCIFSVCIALCIEVAHSDQTDHFTEELFIKTLSRGYIYSHFQFTTKWNSSIHDKKTFQHFDLFPKALGEVLDRFEVQELHLSQTQGLWRHKQWGYPVHPAPPGAELWVWFKTTVKDVDKTWAELVNAVSGLFCSSLNFLDSRSTIAPRWSFRPTGLAPKGFSLFSNFVRYGTLSGEIVCVENLTPWKKLLPCESKAGLATLFNPFLFHDSNYHSLGLHVRSICKDKACTEDGIELSQSLSVVTDLISTSANGSPNWSLKSLFGNHLGSVCPLAEKSNIIIETTHLQDPSRFRLTPTPDSLANVTRGGHPHTYAVYDVRSFTSEGRALNIAGTHTDTTQLVDLSPPPIYAHRYITGYGLKDGGVSCLISNTQDLNQSVIYMDTVPWFTRVFFNTLTVENNGKPVPYKVYYSPAKDRISPYHIEISFNLWPYSVTKISYSFTRAYLKWTEYPPDANHGFFVSSAVITAQLSTSLELTAPPLDTSELSSILSDNSSSFLVRVHTESLIVSLPTPDFSMPYNVICLACTVVAIAFGSVHNLTTRRFVQLDPSKKKGILTKVKAFLFRKKEDKTAEGQESEDKTGAGDDTEDKKSTEKTES